MSTTMELPEGLTSRPLVEGDARAVYEVMAAQELLDLGTVEIEEADIVGDWGRPSFDVSASTIGVFDGEELVAYAEHTGGDRGDAAVHPAYRGRGLGTGLARWMQDTARRHGATVIGMPVPVGSPGDRLLEQLGYEVRWHSWVLQLPEGATIVERPLPPGYAVGEADPSQYREVHTVVEDAFLEWSERERESYEDFASVVVGRPGFEPWMIRVVTDDTGAVVGVATVSIYEPDDDRDPDAFVSRLAVRRDQRHRGLAQALLVDAYARGREHGAPTGGLSTDSRTGALGLYEKVGMRVIMDWVNRAISL
jgi:mycothiol synthase